MRRKARNIVAIVIIIASILVGLFYFNVSFDKKYNLLLISIDTLRPDHLSYTGYFRKTSPNIDALAAEGVIFSNAYCQSE